MADFVVFSDLRVDFLAEDFNDLNPVFGKIWMPDNDKIIFRVSLELEDRLDGKSFVGESNNSFLPTDGVVINPSVVTSRI